MTATVLQAGPVATGAGARLTRALRARVLARLAGLRSGRLVIRDATGTVDTGRPGGLGEIALTVNDPAFWRAVAFGGALGAGESFVRGHWTCDYPVRLVRLLLRDRDVLAGVDSCLARFAQPLLRLGHALRRNSRAGARANIGAHYDLGNDFFAAFLDPSLTYSSAFFATPGMSLEEAQQAKLERLCQKLDLRAGETLLEIGTGWGSMALHAAQRFGARVTTTTISRRQHELALQRVAAAGLQDRITVLQQDYRDLRGTWDKLVSVEMVEAVGHRYLPGYFGRCGELLRPGGAFALQAITIADQHFAAALRRVDFIKKHVFPGSFIPSVTALLQAATRASDLRLFHCEDLAPHYAETLRRWRARLHEQWAAIRAMGYREELLRAWDWYLAYCEGGFAERQLGVCQLVFVKPGAMLPPIAGQLTAPPADPYTATG